jgi:hypothetical protein
MITCYSLMKTTIKVSEKMDLVSLKVDEMRLKKNHCSTYEHSLTHSSKQGGASFEFLDKHNVE